MNARELFTGTLFFILCAVMIAAFSLWSLAWELPG